MKLVKLFFLSFLTLLTLPVYAESLFFEDEPVQLGLNVFEVSDTFAEIYEKLDSVNWAGKNINVAIESLEKLNSNAHIAATDERVVLVWKDSIIANYPRPEPKDWKGFGEITTAIVLKIREQDPNFRKKSESEMYQAVVDSLMKGIDENGRYIFSREAEINEDNRILTSVGLQGNRDNRGNFRITGVFKGSPADNAGIKPGDLISEINGASTKNISDSELDDVLSGFNSSTSKIKLLTPTGNQDVVLRKASVILADSDIVYRNTDDTNAVLEIIVHKISDGTVSIISEALVKYQDATGIILDLRSATGDDERAAAKLSGLFIGKEPVMRIVETAKDEVEVVPDIKAITDSPIVVLMSNMTRGTAEAVVASFYEKQRGVLVGTPTAGQARIASRINLNNGGALELLNKSIKTGAGKIIDGRGIFPIVCLSNIRTKSQQNAFFLNVVNNDFNFKDFNKDDSISTEDIRKGCPVITSGKDEDAVSMAVAVKILTDKKLYNKLIAE